MANINVTEVQGFTELNAKLKRLEDDVKRREVLSLQRKLLEPVRLRYGSNLPTGQGTLSASVAVKTVPKKYSGGNPVVSVVPGKRGENDAYYRFMVIPKGSKPGSIKRGGRKGLNTVVTNARDKTIKEMEGGLIVSAEKETAKLIQKKIDRLSR